METETPAVPVQPEPVVTTPSTKFTFTQANLDSLLKGLLIAVVGAALTYTAQYISKTDFGTATPLVVALFGFIANAVRLYITE